MSLAANRKPAHRVAPCLDVNPGPDLINFGISGGDVQTISRTLDVPTISIPVTIEGTTQGDFAHGPVIELSAGVANGLVIRAIDSRLPGLVISGVSGIRIWIVASDNQPVVGNSPGANLAGTHSVTNSDRGVQICGASEYHGRRPELAASMNSTSISLLERLHRPEETEAWPRFVRLYTPLLFYWARRTGLKQDDAADLVQEVLTVLVQKLPTFQYEPGKSFRRWLHTITLNKWRERGRRKTLPRGGTDDPGVSDVAVPTEAPELDEVEYRDQLVRRALQIMQAEFEPTTWKACWESVVSGRPAAEVAGELGVTVDVVYGAKSRVLRRLRQELAGLLD